MRRRLPLYALLGATALSMVGNMLTFVAIPWFVLQTTGSAAKTGLVGAAATLAFVVASFLGGPVVDRLGFKRTGVVADVASSATVALIPLLHVTIGLAFWQLLALTFLSALLDAPGMTARQSMIPDLARRAGMPVERATAALESIERMSQLLGPPLAGVLIAVMGASNVLWLDAATFAVSAAVVAVAVPSTVRTAETGGNYLADLMEGLRFVLGDRVIFSIVAIAVVLGFFDAPFFSVVLPVFANEVYGDAASFGLSFASFGGGALVGTLAYGAVGHRLPRRATLILGFVVFGLPIFVLATSPPLFVTVISLAVAGFGAGPANPLIFTLIQERTPESLFGRVFGAFISLALAVSPLGMVAGGYALEFFGLQATIIGIATSFLIVALAILVTPALREMDTRSKPPPADE